MTSASSKYCPPFADASFNQQEFFNNREKYFEGKKQQAEEEKIKKSLGKRSDRGDEETRGPSTKRTLSDADIKPSDSPKTPKAKENEATESLALEPVDEVPVVVRTQRISNSVQVQAASVTPLRKPLSTLYNHALHENNFKFMVDQIQREGKMCRLQFVGINDDCVSFGHFKRYPLRLLVASNMPRLVPLWEERTMNEPRLLGGSIVATCVPQGHDSEVYRACDIDNYLGPLIVKRSRMIKVIAWKSVGGKETVWLSFSNSVFHVYNNLSLVRCYLAFAKGAQLEHM